MADMSWMDALVIRSGGGGGSDAGGVTNYDQLTNRPIQNVSGSPVVVSRLPSGVYNIDGTWAITADESPRDTRKDDMFYILNENGVCKLTWITAGDIFTYSVQIEGDAASVVPDKMMKESDNPGTGGNISDMVGTFSDSGKDDPASEDLIGVF